jgi:antitoxin ParD1/3/4
MRGRGLVMPMTRKTITIPDAMDGWVKAQIESGRYGNDSEYFRDLIRRDQEKRQAEQELRALISEGLESGVSSSTVPEIMKRVEDRLKRNGNL